MTYLQLRTPHGRLVAVHDGESLAYMTRLHRVVWAAQDVAEERGLALNADHLEPLTNAEQRLVNALLDLGGQP